jgi:hypothetical protein
MSTMTFQGGSWFQLDRHLTAGALRQAGPGWSGRKLAAAHRFDQRQAGRERDRARRAGDRRDSRWQG